MSGNRLIRHCTCLVALSHFHLHSTAMRTSVSVWIELGFIRFTFFVIAPCIAAMIGYAAWKGKPKSFNREMYWTVFVSSGAAAGFIVVLVQRYGKTWPGPVQLACLVLSALLVGVSLGFGVGIFTRRRGALPD